MFRLSHSLVPALALLAVSAAAARAQTVDFNALPNNFAPYNTYTEDGFTLSAIGSAFNHFHASTGAGGTTGADFLALDGTPFNYSFGGSLFDLVSIDILNIAGTTTFTSSSGAVLNVTTAGTVNFGAGFQSITSVRQDINFRTGLDNIVFRPAGVIPEPGTLALLASSVLPLAGAVVRTRRRNA